ncbi:hypothetical protein B0H13DRAFT_2359864 [Mycena leptocephala]|nr:hypothetical protein B0H13DRAFT_2359864 [Mycena leptocephala]
MRDDNRAVGVHAARIPVRFTSAHGPTQQLHGLAGDQIYVLSACIFYSLLFPILPRRYSPTTSAPPPLRLSSVSSILTDNDTLFSQATRCKRHRRARRWNGAVKRVRYLRGDALQWWVLASPERASMASCGRKGMVKQEERWRAFSLLLAPLLRWVVEWGWTRALARTTCLSFSLGISPSVPFPSRAPALLPFLPSLLSVSILLTRLLVVSTPFSRAARWEIFPEFLSRVRGCLAAQHDIGVGGGTGLASLFPTLLPLAERG